MAWCSGQCVPVMFSWPAKSDPESRQTRYTVLTVLLDRIFLPTPHPAAKEHQPRSAADLSALTGELPPLLKMSGRKSPYISFSSVSLSF